VQGIDCIESCRKLSPLTIKYIFLFPVMVSPPSLAGRKRDSLHKLRNQTLRVVTVVFFVLFDVCTVLFTKEKFQSEKCWDTTNVATMKNLKSTWIPTTVAIPIVQRSRMLLGFLRGPKIATRYEWDKDVGRQKRLRVSQDFTYELTLQYIRGPSPSNTMPTTV